MLHIFQPKIHAFGIQNLTLQQHLVGPPQNAMTQGKRAKAWKIWK